MNINEATFEELQSIHGVGVAGAGTIIQLRYERDTLTLEDIREVMGDDIAATMGEICSFSPSKHEDVGLCEDPQLGPTMIPPSSELTPPPEELATSVEGVSLSVEPGAVRPVHYRPPPYELFGTSASREDTGPGMWDHMFDKPRSTGNTDRFTVPGMIPSSVDPSGSVSKIANHVIGHPPIVTRKTPNTDYNELLNAVESIKQQRAEDKRLFEDRLNLMNEQHRLKAREDEERYQALRKRADSERQRLENAVANETKAKTDLQRLVGELRRQKLNLPSAAVAPPSAVVPPKVGDTNLAKQRLVKLSMEYDQQLESVEKSLAQLKEEKQIRVRELESAIYEDPSIIASKLVSPQHSTPAVKSPRVQHLLTSINKIAPTGVYVGRNDRVAVEESFNDPVLTTPLQRNVPRRGSLPRFNLSNAGDRINASSIGGASQRSGSRQDKSSDSLPKLGKYDGTGQWKSFYMQFKMYASIKGWTEEQKLHNLCLCLKDKALDFYVCQSEFIQDDFEQMVYKMEKRFGKKDIAETLRDRFNRMRQKVDEPLEEWAERVQKIAQEAYVNLPEEFMAKEVVRKFCQGISDRETAQYASDRRPRCIEEALQLVKSHIENSRAIYGSKKAVRLLAYDDEPLDSPQRRDFSIDEHDYTTSSDVRQSSNTDGDSVAVRSIARQNFVDLDKQVKKLEDTFTKKFDQLWQFLKEKDTRPVARSLTPPTSPRRGACFMCGEMGHYSRDCKNRSILKTSPGSPTTVKKPEASGSPKKSVSFNPLNQKRSDA